MSFFTRDGRGLRMALQRLVPVLVITLSSAIAVADGPAKAQTKPPTIDSVYLQKEAVIGAKLTAADRAKLVRAGNELIARVDAKPAKDAQRDAPPKTPETHARDLATALSQGQDVEALAFLVLMSAAKSAQEDVKAVMASVKAINALKECKGSKPCISGLKPTAEYDLATLDRARSQIDETRGIVGSLDGLGELSQIRLQMAMDRMSKMMSTLSNILKKMSDTAQSITQNLK